MSIDYTTLRWKLFNKPKNLTKKDIEALTDLITEKLGFEAPDIKPPAVKKEPKGRKQATAKDDPYTEVFKRSPNQSGTIRPKFIVIHDSCGSHNGTKSWILNKESKVSYHYLIDAKGNRTQFVGDTKKAWHAGKSRWKGVSGLNSCSVGIAFFGDTTKERAPAPSRKEIDSCARKCIYLMKKFGIGIDGIVTHAMISPGRKTDTSKTTHAKVLERVEKLQGA